MVIFKKEVFDKILDTIMCLYNVSVKKKKKIC